MKLGEAEMEALCEYVDGRREAGDSYDVIADALREYTVPQKAGEAPRLTEEDLDGLERIHRKWKRGKAYLERQRESGDVRAGTGMIAEVAVDWSAVDAGAVQVRLANEGGGGVSLLERADALSVVMRLKRSLLKAEGRWVSCRTRVLKPGVEWRQLRGPGRLEMPDGRVMEWLWGAVVFSCNGVVQEVFAECRKRRIHPVGYNGCKNPAMDMERRELCGEKIDLRGLAAELATVLHTCLGGERSPFRNNEHLAQLLGVTREAMRVRKKRIMKEAGIRSAEGQVPARANGGKATQGRRSRGEGDLINLGDGTAAASTKTK